MIGVLQEAERWEQDARVLSARRVCRDWVRGCRRGGSGGGPPRVCVCFFSNTVYCCSDTPVHRVAYFWLRSDGTAADASVSLLSRPAAIGSWFQQSFSRPQWLQGVFGGGGSRGADAAATP